jgi:hypothetical protein
LPDEVDEFVITLKSELTGFWLERGLVRSYRQLMLDEGAQRFGNEVELPGKLLVRPTKAVEPEAESFIEFGGTATIQPRAERVREDRGLR